MTRTAGSACPFVLSACARELPALVARDELGPVMKADPSRRSHPLPSGTGQERLAGGADPTFTVARS